jgi:D-3-phosphoglycerate dehydrogenase
MQRVTGIGGVLIKAKDPKALCEWYEKHLGIEFGKNTYVGFESKGNETTAFSFFEQSSKYFAPGKNEVVMLNFRVENLDELLAALKQEGVEIAGQAQEYEGMGKFGWIIDLEGNKVELWQPAE